MSNSEQTPPVVNKPADIQPRKKKLGCLAWLGIVFGGFILLGIIGAFLPELGGRRGHRAEGKAPTNGLAEVKIKNDEPNNQTSCPCVKYILPFSNTPVRRG
jgi:hypothetical protein